MSSSIKQRYLKAIEDEFDKWYHSVIADSMNSSKPKQELNQQEALEYIHEPYGPSYGVSGADLAEALYYETHKQPQ